PQLTPPGRVVLGGIGVHGLLVPTVDRQIGLLVTLDVERGDPQPPVRGCLEDRGEDGPTVPFDFPRPADAERHDLHLSTLRQDRRPPNASAWSATNSRTPVAGRPVTRSTPSACRSYRFARCNSPIAATCWATCSGSPARCSPASQASAGTSAYVTSRSSA